MIKYIIYLAAAALIVWSVYYVAKNIHRQLHGKHSCDGNCEGCSLDCKAREKKK